VFNFLVCIRFIFVEHSPSNSLAEVIMDHTLEV
jgi:hypothetical protein